MSDNKRQAELNTAFLKACIDTIGVHQFKKSSIFIRNADNNQSGDVVSASMMVGTISDNTDREAVTRYRPIRDTNGDAGMVPCTTGFWVTIDDYRDILAAKDQAEAENKALEAERDKLREARAKEDALQHLADIGQLHERIAALDVDRNKLREALRKISEMPGRRWQRLAARAALAETAHCCVCDAFVDTRAIKDGADTDGRQLSDGSWVCSSECWDVTPYLEREPHA